MRSSKNKVYAFIDAENVRNSAEELGYTDLDYIKLINLLKKKKGIEKVYLYVGIELGDSDKERKFEDLKKIGYIVLAKQVASYKQKPWYIRTECPGCKKSFVKIVHRKDKKKANCDVDLTLDVVRHGCANDFDEAIIFSGDGDFVRVHEYLVNELGKKVTVYAPNNHRTHKRIKELNREGIIKWENLNNILSHYGEKSTIL